MNIAAMLGVALVAFAPPSGRPPVGPLKRVEPRVYDFSIDVTVTTQWQYDATLQRSYLLADAPIVMPIIFQGTYSTVRSDSVRGQLWLQGRPDGTAGRRMRTDDGFPYQTHMAVIPIQEFGGKSLRWRLAYRVQVWASELKSEQAAASIAWPREWPQEVLDGLRPQKFIESDDPFFAAAVQRATGGRLRLVPPYIAAKELVRFSIGHMRTSGSGSRRGMAGMLHGMEMIGARRAAEAGLGSPHDLVCVCVAMLRAAGIPARPVIGVRRNEAEGDRTKDFASWAEFYLPQVGWVPFDPIEMPRGSIRTLDVRRPWPEFGTMDDLNERIPLAYHYMPPAMVQTPQNPAVWGWDPRPGGDPGTEQQIRFGMVSRGRGKDDPR